MSAPFIYCTASSIDWTISGGKCMHMYGDNTTETQILSENEV